MKFKEWVRDTQGLYAAKHGKPPTQREISKTLRVAIEALAFLLYEGESVCVGNDFGVFTTTSRDPQTIYSNLTQEEHHIDERRSVKFKPSKALTRRLNSGFYQEEP